MAIPKTFDYQINTAMNPGSVRFYVLASNPENLNPRKTIDLFGKSVIQRFSRLQHQILNNIDAIAHQHDEKRRYMLLPEE
jgi:hypothetical protein